MKKMFIITAMKRDKLKEIKLRYVEHNQEILKENEELVNLYNSYTKNVVELFDFLIGRDDDLFYTIVFDILLQIGFFSYNNSFDKSQDIFQELSIKPGMSILNGMGVCRNIACFYEDVMKHFYQYPLKLCCLDKNHIDDDATNVFGNHTINLTMYHDLYYAYDIMNSCLFVPIDAERLKALGCEYYLTYKEYGNILLRLTTDLELKNDYIYELATIKNILSYSAKKNISNTIRENDFEKLDDRANDFILENKKILASFLKDNEECIETVKAKMLILK